MVFHFVLFSVICLSSALFGFLLQKAFTMGWVYTLVGLYREESYRTNGMDGRTGRRDSMRC